MIKKPTPLCGDNDPATRLLWNDIVTEGNQFFRREYHFGKECYEAGDISPLRVDTLVNDTDVFTKALNGAEMGRMVPRLYGYLNESRQLPIQPIGQHKVTSDAVGWYPDKPISIAQRADTYAISVGRLNKYLERRKERTNQDDDPNDYGSILACSGSIDLGLIVD